MGILDSGSKTEKTEETTEPLAEAVAEKEQMPEAPKEDFLEKLHDPKNIKRSFELKVENDDDDDIFIVHEEEEDQNSLFVEGSNTHFTFEEDKDENILIKS